MFLATFILFDAEMGDPVQDVNTNSTTTRQQTHRGASLVHLDSTAPAQEAQTGKGAWVFQSWENTNHVYRNSSPQQVSRV